MQRGFTLRYNGETFDGSPVDIDGREANANSGLEELQNRFSNLGSLVIRYHIGHGQRAGLLQQVARYDYHNDPVEKPAHGRNQNNLFQPNNGESNVAHETRMLEESAHTTIGRGKVLNERAQPLVHMNDKDIHGEELLWDAMHAPVWNTGRSLAFQLGNQGFLYIAHPEKLSTDEYASITRNLANQHYELINIPATYIVTKSGHRLSATPKFASLQIGIDLDRTVTYQDNALVITLNSEEGGTNQAAPLGWIIHTKSGEMVALDHTDHIMRIIRISKGGFYELPPAQQKALQAGLLKNNGNGLFTENQAFNAMSVILSELERKYNFNPAALLPKKSLNSTYKRIKELTLDATNTLIEDFLTGIIITEMVQHLKLTQANSMRSLLPLRFTNPYKVTRNNARAIAHAFKLTKLDGAPVLYHLNGEPQFSDDNELLDVRINGVLAQPDLNHPKHIAALLSTGVLVAEQMLIEQLLKAAIVHGDEHPYTIALKKIIKDTEVYNAILAMAKTQPVGNTGPMLGLQFRNCEDMVTILRRSLWGKHPKSNLANTVRTLRNSKDTATDIKTNELHANLEKLFEIGEILQTLPGISVKDQHSRGINAGIALVIQKLAPELYQKLLHENRLSMPCPDLHQSSEQSSGKPKHSEENYGVCPYLRGAQIKPAETTANTMHEATPLAANESAKPSAKKTNSWCCHFSNKTAVTTALTTTTLITAVVASYLL